MGLAFAFKYMDRNLIDETTVRQYGILTSRFNETIGDYETAITIGFRKNDIVDFYEYTFYITEKVINEESLLLFNKDCIPWLKVKDINDENHIIAFDIEKANICNKKTNKTFSVCFYDEIANIIKACTHLEVNIILKDGRIAVVQVPEHIFAEWYNIIEFDMKTNVTASDLYYYKNFLCRRRADLQYRAPTKEEIETQKKFDEIFYELFGVSKTEKKLQKGTG